MSSCFVRPAIKEDALFLARTVMEAIGEELCLGMVGSRARMPLVRRLFANLAASDESQYSYKNSWVACSPDGSTCGAVIAYDGARLGRLRTAFIREANALLGWNIDEYEAQHWEAEAEAGEIYIDSLFVLPVFRRQGLASQLVASVLDRYRTAGKPFGLLVEPGNLAAKHTYERLGFRKVGVNGFFGVEMDHMQRSL